MDTAVAEVGDVLDLVVGEGDLIQRRVRVNGAGRDEIDEGLGGAVLDGGGSDRWRLCEGWRSDQHKPQDEQTEQRAT
jgi:hypothetical protein